MHVHTHTHTHTHIHTHTHVCIYTQEKDVPLPAIILLHMFWRTPSGSILTKHSVITMNVINCAELRGAWSSQNGRVAAVCIAEEAESSGALSLSKGKGGNQRSKWHNNNDDWNQVREEKNTVTPTAAEVAVEMMMLVACWWSESRWDQEEGGELDSHDETSPEEIKSREVELG